MAIQHRPLDAGGGECGDWIDGIGCREMGLHFVVLDMGGLCMNSLDNNLNGTGRQQRQRR